jgi:hypothetical protein
MIERAFARTFRNFSTIFMLVAVVVLPIHLIYAFTFRNVIATSDFHEAIEQMPNYQQVRSVGPPQLDDARLVFWIVTAVELALVPLAVRATRRVFIVDDEGKVPTAPDAWGRALQRQEGRKFRPGWVVPAVVGVAAAGAAGTLVALIGSSLTGFLSEDWRWTGVGLTQALARATAVPLALGPLALVRAKEGAPSAPKLY